MINTLFPLLQNNAQTLVTVLCSLSRQTAGEKICERKAFEWNPLDILGSVLYMEKTVFIINKILPAVRKLLMWLKDFKAKLFLS